MELYLMQHGHSFSKEIDPKQPLSPVGTEQTEQSARAAGKLGLCFEAVISSTKLRAEQTAALMAKGTGYPVSAVVKTDLVKAMASTAEAMAFLKKYEARASVLICTHLPFAANFASALMSGGPSARIRVENGGLLCLDVPELPTNAAVLKYYLTPRHLKLLAEV